MKSAAFALALMISTVQTVGWVECCCILICKHQNDPCQKCSDEKPENAPKESCCEEPQHPAKEEPRCAHVEPSSEVASHATPLPPVVLDVVLELPVVLSLKPPSEHDKTNGSFCRSRGSPPLHILYSTLLI